MSITDPATCGFGKVLVYNIAIEKIKLPWEDGEPEKHYKGLFKIVLLLNFLEFNASFPSEQNQQKVTVEEFICAA